MPYDEDELTGEEEHERDAYYPGSNYERCPHHGEVISNGVFDAPCGGCEAGEEQEPETLTPEQLAAREEWLAEVVLNERRRAENATDEIPF